MVVFNQNHVGRTHHTVAVGVAQTERNARPQLAAVQPLALTFVRSAITVPVDADAINELTLAGNAVTRLVFIETGVEVAIAGHPVPVAIRLPFLENPVARADTLLGPTGA
jgi:hypothetical protein